eukprot:3310871-Amphidinium_carterae.1
MAEVHSRTSLVIPIVIISVAALFDLALVVLREAKYNCFWADAYVHSRLGSPRQCGFHLAVRFGEA